MALQLLTPQLANLNGRLYSGNLSEIQYRIDLALDRTQSLIIDLDLLDVIDNAGAYMLYITTKKAKERNKEIILRCRNNEFVKVIFIALGLRYSNSVTYFNYYFSNQYQTDTSVI